MSDPLRVALVPGVLALLPQYAGRTDPVADLRAAALDVVAWLGPDVVTVASVQGERVAAHLLSAAEPARRVPATGGGVLVVGNGSATRSERAPGHLDPRAAAFDDALADWLAGGGEPPDDALAEKLWADTAAMKRAAEALPAWPSPGGETTYDDDPYGVRYWVWRWELP